MKSSLLIFGDEIAELALFLEGADFEPEAGPLALEWGIHWFARLHLGVTVSGVFILVSCMVVYMPYSYYKLEYS